MSAAGRTAAVWVALVATALVAAAGRAFDLDLRYYPRHIRDALNSASATTGTGVVDAHADADPDLRWGYELMRAADADAAADTAAAAAGTDFDGDEYARYDAFESQQPAGPWHRYTPPPPASSSPSPLPRRTSGDDDDDDDSLSADVIAYLARHAAPRSSAAAAGDSSARGVFEAIASRLTRVVPDTAASVLAQVTAHAGSSSSKPANGAGAHDGAAAAAGGVPDVVLAGEERIPHDFAAPDPRVGDCSAACQSYRAALVRGAQGRGTGTIGESVTHATAAAAAAAAAAATGSPAGPVARDSDALTKELERRLHAIRSEPSAVRTVRSVEQATRAVAVPVPVPVPVVAADDGRPTNATDRIGRGFLIRDGWLGSDWCRALRTETERIHPAVFLPGEAGVYGWQPDVRGDTNAGLTLDPARRTAWYPHPTTFLHRTMQRMLALAQRELVQATASPAFREALHRPDDSGSALPQRLDWAQTEFMFARYQPTGTRYRAHTDERVLPPTTPSYASSTSRGRATDLNAERPRTGRYWTVVYYVNPDWDAARHEGRLRVYDDPRDDTTAVDVEPVCDRLVVFSAAHVRHEVLPNFGHRYALTAWFHA